VLAVPARAESERLFRFSRHLSAYPT
jgi:hypothetical protein